MMLWLWLVGCSGTCPGDSAQGDTHVANNDLYDELSAWSTKDCKEVEEYIDQDTDVILGMPVSEWVRLYVFDDTVPLTNAVNLTEEPAVILGEMGGSLSWWYRIGCETTPFGIFKSGLASLTVQIDEYDIDIQDNGENNILYIYEDSSWFSTYITVPAAEWSGDATLSLLFQNKEGIISLEGWLTNRECLVFATNPAVLDKGDEFCTD